MNTKIEEILNEYYLASGKGDSLTAIKLIKRINKLETTFWSLTCISSTYFEMGKYKIALRYAEKAMLLNPASPLVLWDYAGALKKNKQRAKAKDIYNKILELSDSEIGRKYTKEGLYWARSLRCDCYYRLAECEYFLNNYESALDYAQRYILARQEKNISSLYEENDIKQWLFFINLRIAENRKI
jgi:tetratricopeptide (TPR) repeat protein